jgi:plastocyanin
MTSSGAARHRAQRSVLVAGALTAAAVVLVGGCERQSPRFDNHAPSAPPAAVATVDAKGDQTLTLKMDDLLRFDPSQIQVRPGKLTVRLVNTGKDPHQFEVPSLNVSTGNIPGGTTTSVVVQIPKGSGSYAFDCAYHTSEHMVGTLTVTGF